jgi:PBSX family phage terminase large subunit
VARESNLIPIKSTEDAKQKGSNGGKKSGEVRRQKKKMKDVMNLMLSLDLPDENSKAVLKNLGVQDEDMNLQTAVVYSQVKRAIAGDLDSAKFCRDTSGEFIGAEEEKEIVQNYVVKIPAQNMVVSFVDINREIDDREYLEFWLEGGRASIKSSFISEKITELLENNPKMCALILRRYSNTLKDSVYSQMQWAISELNDTYKELSSDYKFIKSPMEATKLSTGQKMYFRGLDDPAKIKSIKPPKDMYIGIIWYEEFDQIQGMNAVRKINQSAMRGGNDYVLFYSYNTPPSRQHFVNKEKRKVKKNRRVHLSDYRAVPKKWLGQAFIDEAEYIKETAPKIYENEYLGHETGDGSNVFENLEVREITDEEISSFDRIYNGIDWGWYPDPFAFNRMQYNAAQRTLIIFDEIHCNKKSNRQTADMLLEKGIISEDLITADSAENKSIGDYKDYGFFIRGAEKGPGSVEYSMKWLQGLNKIIIDPVRCPKTLEEFSEYEFEKDKDGNVITGYPDKNNHHIDDVRYAMETVWKRRGQ